MIGRLIKKQRLNCTIPVFNEIVIPVLFVARALCADVIRAYDDVTDRRLVPTPPPLTRKLTVTSCQLWIQQTKYRRKVPALETLNINNCVHVHVLSQKDKLCTCTYFGQSNQCYCNLCEPRHGTYHVECTL